MLAFVINVSQIILFCIWEAQICQKRSKSLYLTDYLHGASEIHEMKALH